MNRRIALAVVAAATAVLVVLGLTSFSSATFSATSSNPATVSAAADWTPPTVAMTAPGSTVKDVVTLAATASDAETGIASVTLQYAATGAGWADVCTDTTAPYSCSWDTRGLADGAYSLRAQATDNAGYSATSATVSTTVANNLVVVLADPGDVVRGTVPLTASLFGAGSVSYSVSIQYAVAGSGRWTTLCTRSAAPYTCDWATAATGGAAVANGDYDLRAIAVSGGVTTSSVVIADVEVDNTAPTVTMTDPGSPLRGTVTLAANPADANSGVARVVIQYAATGTTTWLDACTVLDLPYSCSFATTALKDGSYSFRAVATDVAGNSTTSAVVGNRLVDNTVSSVSVTDPGAYLSDTVTVNANANSSAGVQSVRIQRSPAGTSTWTDLCTDTTSPYSCAWDTTRVADGLYDLRAVLVDGTGRTTLSAVVTNRRVDNTPFRGVDVQTVNGGALAGRLDAGDQVVLTYSEVVTPGTVSAGWDGSPLAVALRLRDGNLLGLGNKGDTLDVMRGNSVLNLGSVNLREDYVKRQKTAQLSATMSLSTVTVNGFPASRVTITVGAQVSGSGLKTVTTPAAMTWTPLAAVLNAAGQAVSTAPVTELGVADREF